MALRDRYTAHKLQTPLLRRLIEKSNDFSSNMFSSSLLVIHNTSRGSEDDITKLAGW